MKEMIATQKGNPYQTPRHAGDFSAGDIGRIAALGLLGLAGGIAVFLWGSSWVLFLPGTGLAWGVGRGLRKQSNTSGVFCAIGCVVLTLLTGWGQTCIQSKQVLSLPEFMVILGRADAAVWIQVALGAALAYTLGRGDNRIHPRVRAAAVECCAKEFPDRKAAQVTVRAEETLRYVLAVYLPDGQTRPMPYELFEVDRQTLQAHRLPDEEAKPYRPIAR